MTFVFCLIFRHNDNPSISGIIQSLTDRTGGTYTPSAGTIYPRLAKLEEEGLVTKTADGRTTIYAITDAGLWGDDSQVVHLRDITHRYESTGNPPGATITILQINDRN